MTKDRTDQPIAAVETTLSELAQQAPAGFAIGLHIKFSTPSFMFQTYPADWMTHYTENGLVLQDPTVLWGFANKGRVSWADLEDTSPEGVMAQAAEHGLSHGMTLAFEQDGSLTIASFSRSDRPFSTQEADAIEAKARDLHALTAPGRNLPPATVEALRALSIRSTH